MRGQVWSAPNAMFRVKLENDHEFSGTPPERCARTIRVLVGDEVLVELTPYDLTKGRITIVSSDRRQRRGYPDRPGLHY